MTYQVLRGAQPVGQYKTLRAALAAIHRKDKAYGASVHWYRYVG
jgi:hypothetical protein